MRGVRAELSQHIKAHAKREAHLCVSEPLSCHQERWGNLCREHRDRKGENKDKKTREPEEDIWKKSEGKRPGGEKKPTAGGNEIQSKPVESMVVFLQGKKVPEDCFFSLQLMKSTSIPIKEKTKGR